MFKGDMVFSEWIYQKDSENTGSRVRKSERPEEESCLIVGEENDTA
jgi:hypothetical protein